MIAKEESKNAPKLTVEQMKSGFCVLWCYNCNRSTIHNLTSRKMGKWGLQTFKERKCIDCGNIKGKNHK